MREIRLFYGLLVLLLITGAFVDYKIVFAINDNNGNPLVYVDPQLIEDLPPCGNFTVSVKVANVTNLYGFDIKLSWDPDLLEYLNHTVTAPIQDYPEGVLYEPINLLKNKVNATAGTIWVAATSQGDVPTFNGTGTIFKVAFHVKSEGRCKLEIYGSDLADKEMPPTHLPHDVEHGYFINFKPPPAEISVYPDNIIDPSLGPCRNFTIDVNLYDVYDLDSFEFSVDYNTTILDVINVNVSEEFPQSNAELNETEGKITVSGSNGAYTGSITLASVIFHVTEKGETMLDLCNVTLIDTWNEPVSYEEPIDGYFNNMLITKLYVDPQLIFDPTLSPGSELSIDIRMQNVIDLYSYQFNLTYNTEVLTCLGALIRTFNNETNFDLQQQIEDPDGYVWINVTYYPPAEPITITNATVTTIYFQIQSFGSSHLNLTHTKMYNRYGDPISHEIGNGRIITVIRDVAIISVELSRYAVYAGWTVNITVVATNLGNLTETFNVTVYYNDTVTIGTQEVVALDPGENCTAPFLWNTTGLQPCDNYTITAQASEVPYEIDTGNNRYVDGVVQIRMLGDVVPDYGVIDIYDMSAVSSVYGSKEGDPNWFPDADVAPLYGVIDLYDVVTVAANYGKTC